MLVVPYKIAKRRRRGRAPLTWGEAMVAAMYVFFVCSGGTASSPTSGSRSPTTSCCWRKDKVWYGPAGIIAKLPFSVSYLVLRDLIVIGIYAVGLVLFVMLWMKWQNRAKTKPTTDVARSNYGRPLVKA